MTATPTPTHLEDPMTARILAADIAPKTKESYLSSLRTLRQIMRGRGGGEEEGGDGPGLEWIACNPHEVLRRIVRTYSNAGTRRRLVAAVRGLFKYGGDLKERRPECHARWGRALEKLDAAQRERQLSAEPSKRERDNWVAWPRVLEKERQLAATDFGGFDHLLLAMYCLIEPLRQNFGRVRIYRAAPPEAPSGENENHLVLTPGGRGTLVLTDYKTSKKYGTFKRDLPPELVAVIEKSLERFPRKYLFVDVEGNPYVHQNSFAKFSNRTLKKLFKKNFTVSLVRHSFISGLDFNEEVPAALFQKAKNMTHSIGMQQHYRRKVPEEPPHLAAAEEEVEETPTPAPTPRPRAGERVVVVRI